MMTATATNTKKITLATLKAFIRKNRDALLIMVSSSFDGMTDCVEQNMQATFVPAQQARPGCEENTLGVAGVWCVLGSRDRIRPYAKDGITGFEVYNCCGSFTVGVRNNATA